MKQSVKGIQVKSIVAVAVILLTTAFSVAQNKAQEIEKLMNQYTEYEQFNGSVLVAENGKIIYQNGHGFANLEHDIPNRTNTRHRLGSITKQFTAALILQLAEQGILKLDEPVSTYLKEYPGTTGGDITVHHLLTHTSGIPNYTAFPQGFLENHMRNTYTPKEFVKKFQDSALHFSPGERFEYSNSGYFLLGMIIEEVTGKPYEQVLQQDILDPLEMTGTGYDHQSPIIKNRASGYERNGTGYINAPFLDMSIPYAAGSMYSTVEDLYRWDQALYKGEILSEKSLKLMFAPHIPDGRGNYGYGWSTGFFPLGIPNDSTMVQIHGGGIPGFNALIARIPSNKQLIVLLNNTGATNLIEMATSINSILYEVDYEEPKRSVAGSVLPVFMNEGIDAGRAYFEVIKNEGTYALRENEMNRAGYQLLSARKVNEAIELFRINVEAFPDSWNVYDSLGEAYMNAGDKEQAILNYKKSIEMNPGNENGIKILKELEKM